MPARLIGPGASNGRRRSLRALFLLALSAATPGWADEATIAVDVSVEANAAEAIAGALVVGFGEPASEARVLLSAPGRAEVLVPADTAVSIAAEFEGFWGAPVVGIAGGEPLRIRLFPTGQVGGTVHVPQGTPAPASLRVSFEAPAGVRALGLPTAEGSVDCPVADGEWSCTLPEGVLDLRLHAPGFASVLLWEVPVQAGVSGPGGALRLVPGAAVLGQVSIEGPVARDPSESSVMVEIRPQGADPRDAYGSERLGHLFEEVEVDRRGYFQFRDLPAGQYRVEARAAGRAPAVRADVEVLEGRETDLGRPLVLLPPSRLELQLDPLVAPDGERWTVRLSAADGSTDPHVTRADWTGFGLIRDLSPGKYRYLVTSRGSTWATGEAEISEDVETLAIEVPLVPIHGTVRRGEEPARALVVFGGSREHPERIEVFADPEGNFSGHLPREGRWPAYAVVERNGAEQGLDPIDVFRAPGEEAAWIEIELFDTEIRGRVVDDAGRPVSRGGVLATRSDSEGARRTNARLDREGRFHLEGVPPGTWTLDAVAGGDSGRVVVELEEDEEEEVEIRLSGGRLVSGRVVSPRGPVAAARLYLVPEIAEVYPLAPTKTGPMGEFSERLPRNTPRVHVLVMAPGYAARILALSLPPDGEPVEGFEVAVGEISGTLRLELPEGESGGIELRRGPVRVPLMLLAPWAGYHRARPGNMWELPAMEPGAYQLCSREACEGGTLGLGATLVLRLEHPDGEESANAESGG